MNDLQREALEKVAECACEALAQVDEWLGSASTRQAAEESLWRLRRALRRAGYEIPNGDLEYRGSILRAMEHCRIGMDDEGVIRLRRYEDKPWQHASGEPLYEVLYRMRMKADHRKPTPRPTVAVADDAASTAEVPKKSVEQAATAPPNNRDDKWLAHVVSRWLLDVREGHYEPDGQTAMGIIDDVRKHDARAVAAVKGREATDANS